MESFGIEFNGSAKVDGAQLFDALSLDIPKGKWTCLLGGSGVGKSTILRLIAGLPTGAEFTGEIRSSSGPKLSENIALMAQDDLLLPWASVAQNVALGSQLRGQKPDLQRAQTLLKQVGLQDHAHKKPQELSGGQRQRAALARTLMEDKPVVLLDEPFSALDAQTRLMMQDLAVEIFQDKTVLIVTHDPSEAARLGDKIAILRPAGIVDISPPEGPTPRSMRAIETLKCQADLLAMLQEGPV